MDTLKRIIASQIMAQKRQNEETIIHWMITGMEGRLEEGPDSVVVVRPCPPERYGELVIHQVRHNADGTISEPIDGSNMPWE